MPLIYREIEVPVEMAHVVFCAWVFLTEATDPALIQHQVPPDGTTNLVLTSAPDGSPHPWLVGPSLVASALPVSRGSRVCGLRLRPESARVAVGKIPVPGTSEPLPLNDHLAPIWQDLEALLDGRFSWSGAIGQFKGGATGDAQVTSAVDRLIIAGGDVSVSELAASDHLSERQFRRRFRAATGITPKRFADVQRLRHALIKSLRKQDWAGIAQASGFADQPHLTRDIKERFGTPPGEVAGYLSGIRHEMLSHGGVRFVQDAMPSSA